MTTHPVFQVLEPAAATVPLISLAIQGRYEGPAPHVPYVVGVDTRFVFSRSLSVLEYSRLNLVRGSNNASRAGGTVRMLRRAKILPSAHFYFASLASPVCQSS
jgi:hypothetical protein